MVGCAYPCVEEELLLHVQCPTCLLDAALVLVQHALLPLGPSRVLQIPEGGRGGDWSERRQGGSIDSMWVVDRGRTCSQHASTIIACLYNRYRYGLHVHVHELLVDRLEREVEELGREPASLLRGVELQLCLDLLDLGVGVAGGGGGGGLRGDRGEGEMGGRRGGGGGEGEGTGSHLCCGGGCGASASPSSEVEGGEGGGGRGGGGGGGEEGRGGGWGGGGGSGGGGEETHTT